ncbi:MAG: hypothetical protein H0W36_14420 [Gemmatimonadetes bacterium]|nr:hypothetical protein [Gemmatimonadota bacterium]
MGSFLTGVACAAVLAAGTLWVLEAGTITMVERSDDLSTVIKNIWSERSEPLEEPAVTR